ncbi:hydantoinase/oxoprolinase family protein [Microvirga sp. M2]|uniref:hydantoinase/oxoprolinase family protein n=1 Tax=Microvirga sp. M2 TaxID=3073270 RepID=UPI0039C46882
MLRIGVDIGGTFTDFAIWKDERDGYVEIGSHKRPTTYPNFADAVIQGVIEIAERCAIPADASVLVVHGTTISTNAVIERSQPPVALLTTQGYRDLLGIARLRLDKPIDLFNRRPAPIVPRERVFEIRERLLSDGSVDTPIDDASVIAALRAAREKGAQAVGICFLHGYRNPVHERRALELARVHFPDLDVMASHEVWPQQSEYERAVLTLLNVYVKRLMDSYLKEVDDFLQSRFPRSRLAITKSNGGIMSSAEAREVPVHTLLSGPAAGVTAAQAVGELLGLEQVLTFDMGGTSTDVSLIERGRPVTTGQAEVGDFPLLMPVTAIEAMGAGGGSIVWLDAGVLKVGPRSARSQPGPACYGQGGREPTLTDAYLLMNYLSPKGLLGGKLSLDRSLAEEAFRPIADALGTDAVGAAQSAIAVATSTMMTRVLPFLARCGVGPNDLALMIYGGAGGIHGPLLAEECGIRHIVVPRLPSVFCAFGGLVSDLVHDGVHSLHGVSLSREGIARRFDTLRAEGEAWLARQSHDEQILAVDRVYLADMRYGAQSFTIPIDLSGRLEAGLELDAVFALFHREHHRLFGHCDENSPVVIDNLRLRTIGRQAKPAAVPLDPGEPLEPRPIETRPILVEGRWVAEAPVYSWPEMRVGQRIEGPAIVQQDLATILVPQGFRAKLTAFGDLEMTKG